MSRPHSIQCLRQYKNTIVRPQPLQCLRQDPKIVEAEHVHARDKILRSLSQPQPLTCLRHDPKIFWGRLQTLHSNSRLRRLVFEPELSCFRGDPELTIWCTFAGLRSGGSGSCRASRPGDLSEVPGVNVSSVG